MAIISCPECNKSLSDKAIHCPNCGYPVSGDKPSDQCEDCGKPVLNGLSSCAACGCPVNAISTVSVSTDTSLCDANTKSMLIGSILGLLSGIIYVIVFLKYSSVILMITMIISAQSTKSLVRLDKRCSLKVAMTSYVLGIVIGIVYCTNSEWFTSLLYKKRILKMY